MQSKNGMKNNLENISFHEVLNQNGTNYVSFRKSLKPSYGKVIVDLSKGYLFLLLLFTVTLIVIRYDTFWSFVAIPVSAFLIGYVLAYLHLFIHAAAHYNLHPKKQLNDRISDYMIGIFFGIEQKKYRKIHWMHHNDLGTKEDTEHSYFNELNTLFLLKCLTGMHTILVILGRKKHNAQAENAHSSVRFALSIIIFHSVLVSILFLLGGWKLLVAWLVGLLIFFPAFAAVRQLLEHRDTKASKTINYHETDHGKVSRLFGKGIIDSSFGAAGFNRHLLHHWDPTLSYTTLPTVEDYLRKCPETSSIIEKSKTSYIKTFLALFKI